MAVDHAEGRSKTERGAKLDVPIRGVDADRGERFGGHGIGPLAATGCPATGRPGRDKAGGRERAGGASVPRLDQARSGDRPFRSATWLRASLWLLRPTIWRPGTAL